MLELQSNAISTLANNQIPGTNTWVAIINWLNDFLQPIEKDYDIVFLDANPSFSMYTQIAIATSTKVVLPVMADDSSRRAIQNAFSLIYGLKLPSEIYSKYAFAEKLKEAGFTVTQATISRDIRQMNLSKLPTGNGRQKYVILKKENELLSDKYIRVLRDAFVSMDMAQNILVMRTVSGMAMAVAAALDAIHFGEVVGCIAGDDTIMIAVRSVEDTRILMGKIRELMKQ